MAQVTKRDRATQRIHLRRVETEMDGEDREVDAAVVGHDEAAVAGEVGAIRAARDRGDLGESTRRRIDSKQSAGRDRGHDEGPVRTPDGSLAEGNLCGDDFVLHGGQHGRRAGTRPYGYGTRRAGMRADRRSIMLAPVKIAAHSRRRS